MSENVDLYQILGVSRNCSPEELKKSYKKLCIQHHPDKGGDEEVFKKISEAYNILKDAEKREIYDKYGFDGLKNGMAQNVDVQEMMENLFGFGFGGGRSQNRPPPPRYVPLHLSLEDVVNGNSNFVYDYDRRIVDRTKERKTCNLCQGKGFRVMNRQVGFMQMQQQVECPQCKGAKYDNANELFQSVHESVQIPIPKNCGEHHKFVLRNKQDERLDGESGDIVLVVEYKEHPIFKRNGHDLYITFNLSTIESLSGFKRRITLLDQTVMEIEYAEMVKWGEILCVPKKGLYDHERHRYGDLYFMFDIDYPPSATLSLDTLGQLKSSLQVEGRKRCPSELESRKLNILTAKSGNDPSQEQQRPQSHPGQGHSQVPLNMPFHMPGMPGNSPGAMECHQQ